MKKIASIKFTASPANYLEAIKNSQGIFLQFTTMSRELESAVIRIIHRYLEEYDILYLKNPIMNVAKEIMNNAIKANVKRIYFSRENLDISSESDYRKGMAAFKAHVYGNGGDEIFRLLGESGLWVRISFESRPDTIVISVINNSPILDVELRKVKDRVAKAYEYHNISDAFEDIIDDTEGAGLGLIMAIMVFKNSGLPADSFTITGDRGETAVSLSIPKKMARTETKMRIAEKIVKEIINLPSFPENITRIRKLCADPQVRESRITDIISKDPGLTASVLMHANSPAYMTDHKIRTIEDAVKSLGISGINALLVASGVTGIMGSKYRKYESLWKKSNRRAFYAQKLSIQLKVSALNDFAYLTGLLADIGSMVLLSIAPDLIEKLKEIAGYKGIDDTNMLEEISLGLSHSSLGAMLCEKWKFDEALVKAVEFHHRPYMAPINYIQIVYIVYLADIFIEIEEKKNRYATVDNDVLDYFKINNEKRFRMLHDVLKKAFSARLLKP